jgi:hypothetical protein
VNHQITNPTPPTIVRTIIAINNPKTRVRLFFFLCRSSQVSSLYCRVNHPLVAEREKESGEREINDRKGIRLPDDFLILIWRCLRIDLLHMDGYGKPSPKRRILDYRHSIVELSLVTCNSGDFGQFCQIIRINLKEFLSSRQCEGAIRIFGIVSRVVSFVTRTMDN